MKRISAPERAFTIYAAMDAGERKEFWAYCAGYDRALGLAGVVPEPPKRRGRPVGSKNKAVLHEAVQNSLSSQTLKNTAEAQGVGQ